MQFQDYEKWSDMVRKAQEPFQAIAELNMKTLQSLNYLKPEELTHIKKPEEFLEKQIHLVVENGQKTLDYMQKSFKILEQAMLDMTTESQKKAASSKK
ncbi:MAG: hypothetical protein CK426_01045 [Legionella sp.]|nr:MAG: hypothetical protein CK423_09410 [Legionella sp.]PJD99948.1 MAG: hypothetical protein CK426_01045 [Legionella sp.]